jgi:hypothetical protein
MKIKQVLKGIGIGALAVGLVGCSAEPQTVVVEKEVVKYVNVTKEVEVEKEVVVEVESEESKAIKSYLEESEGDFTTAYAEAGDEDELVDVMVFDLDMRALALAYVENELYDELDREEVNGTTLDEDDMKRLKIDSDFDEVINTDLDFDREEATYNITGEFEQDDEEFEFEVEVVLEDYEVDDFNIVSITRKQ